MTPYHRSIKADRDAWREEQDQVCMYCGREAGGLLGIFTLEIHEIERRSQAQKRYGHRCNYLLLCNMCHETDFASMDHARQLAVKLLKDPANFDLVEWLRLKDPELRAPNRVMLEDIAQHLDLK